MLKLSLFDFKQVKSFSICVPSISCDPVHKQVIVFIKPQKMDSDLLLEKLQEVGCRFMTWFGGDEMRMTIPMSILDQIEDWGNESIPLYCPH